MATKTLYIAEIDGDTSFQHVTIDILDEPICMNLGVAYMPFMNHGYYFLEEDNIASPEKAEGFNEVETTFVKYLYKIRKCNRTGEKIEYSVINSPNSRTLRNRIFIGGKIFPDIAIYYGANFSGIAGIGAKDADCSSAKFELKNKSNLYANYPTYSRTGEKNKKEYFEKFNDLYISIDKDKINILVPKTAMGINYLSILVDFLKNGEMTKKAATHGEFPDLETYTLATGRTKLEKGCWLKKDREDKSFGGDAGNTTFQNACWYIIENRLQGVLAPFAQIYSFYHFVDSRMFEYKHKTRWCIGAKKLVKSLDYWLEGQGIFNIPIDDYVETILCELNVGICDYAITQFYELFYGKYKNAPLNTLEKAYQFDLQFVQHEQGVVAVPIYAKTSDGTIKKYQAMADYKGVIGYGSGKISNAIPEFDVWKGKVTDAQFRIDLPMLMLWLDRHKPTIKDKNSPFYGKVDKNGFLLEDYKEKIRPYEAK